MKTEQEIREQLDAIMDQAQDPAPGATGVDESKVLEAMLENNAAAAVELAEAHVETTAAQEEVANSQREIQKMINKLETCASQMGSVDALKAEIVVLEAEVEKAKTAWRIEASQRFQAQKDAGVLREANEKLKAEIEKWRADEALLVKQLEATEVENDRLRKTLQEATEGKDANAEKMLKRVTATLTNILDALNGRGYGTDPVKTEPTRDADSDR